MWIIAEPVVDMLETPNANAPVVSEALCNEKISIVARQGDWTNIKTPDGYTGWVPLSRLAQESSTSPLVHISQVWAHIYPESRFELSPIARLPFGVGLPLIGPVDATWLKVSLPGGQEGFIRSDAARPKQLLTKIDLVTLSQQFLYTPYKWGGRSAFGYDCSGFVQMLYEQIGILLPRDSKDQILDPRLKPIEEEALEGGDLLFFGTSAKNIGHVALYIGEGRFIHATARENRPWIRISRLSDAPWLPTETGFYPYRRAICF